MHKRKHFRRGILGDTISYTYLTILALLAAFSAVLDISIFCKEQGRTDSESHCDFPSGLFAGVL